jgi:all-trans-8'-apo-beta-carotenal 15,15'-oxygenase
MIHDAAVTDRHFVFFISPLRFRMMRAGFGFGSFSDNMMWEPELGTEVVVVPLDQPDRPIRMQTEPFFQWHFANAYERRSHSGGSNGEIAVDLVRYPDFRSNRYVGQLKDGEMQVDPEPAFWRAVLDLQARRIVWEKRNEERGEFPRIHPDYQGCHYRYAWMAGHSHHTVARERPWDVLARMDVETGERRVVGLDGGGVPSEPILLPRSGDEEDGYLLTLVYDPGRHASYVAVLDARRFEEGPVARVWFDHHIPPTLHGAAVPLP